MMIVRVCCGLVLGLPLVAGAVDRTDPRVRVEHYSAQSVVTVYAKRGVTTHIQLDRDEQIDYVATGVGGDCGKATDSWCVIAPMHGNQMFIKPKSTAEGSNNIAVATDRRAYSLRFVVVGDEDTREPVYRLTFAYDEPKRVAAITPAPQVEAAPQPLVVVPMPSAKETVKERLKEAPQVRNAQYSMAIGKRSGDIVPTLVFDDGRFTYFKYPNNREVPAVFEVSEDGQESVVNVRMELNPDTGQRDLVVADRVARRFYLRRGKAVVGIWNDAFDLDGVPPANGTTVAGVERVLRGE